MSAGAFTDAGTPGCEVGSARQRLPTSVTFRPPALADSVSASFYSFGLRRPSASVSDDLLASHGCLRRVVGECPERITEDELGWGLRA